MTELLKKSIFSNRFKSVLPGESIQMGKEYPSSPAVAVGAVVFHEDKVLLVRRGTPPAQDQWSIPGGSVELGERMEAAVEREILEETGIRVKADRPVFAFDTVKRDEWGRVRFHYVIVDFAARYVSGNLMPGDDALEARWVSESEMADLDINIRTAELLSAQYGFGK